MLRARGPSERAACLSLNKRYEDARHATLRRNAPVRKMVDSPCIKICELNGGNFCTGCGRTREEIGGWTRMSDEQKKATIARARARLKDEGGKARRG